MFHMLIIFAKPFPCPPIDSVLKLKVRDHQN